ncbi:hypothetical protein CCACVL1_23575 [Corchorus capsularis]|uniref:Uncharacterized protein n=1 Tax=Corchorus capsularis TaxID=210143 RepID=A0A1R3GTC8_COCAP|nr:hypothetical protein CCACVL1_23575 [Corchorus capsularis]
MEIDPKTKDYKAFTEVVPLFLVIAIFVILFLPFNILYRSSILPSHMFVTLYLCPLCKVTPSDFSLVIN